ncbi:MAG: hypothetical protein ACJ73U_23530, partial [Actinophytocola sp.]
AAVRAAVAEIDQHGSARLLFAPGQYRLTRSRFAPWRRGRLDSIALPGLPVTPALDTGWDALDRELADLLNGTHPTLSRPTDRPATGGGVATLDRAPNRQGDQQESTPIDTNDSGSDRPGKRSRSPRKSSRKPRQMSARSIEDLRAELSTRIEADPRSIDPTSAESIRRALHCSPARARELRDTYRPNH